MKKKKITYFIRTYHNSFVSCCIGLTEKQAREIVEQHERNVEELTEQREEQRKKQEQAIKVHV